MAEACNGPPPQVFVVDSQACPVSVPMGRKQRWERASKNFLLLTLVLVVFGLVVQGYLIHSLNKKMETFSHRLSHLTSQNLSGPISSSLQGDKMQSQDRPKGTTNEITMIRPQTVDQERPFAHLMGSNRTVDKDNVVQWLNNSGDSITYNMGYRNGRLLVEKEGYYYIYSKVSLDAEEECLYFQHEVWRDTTAYGKPIQLLKSKRPRCLTDRPANRNPSAVDDYWNSFLAGIFELNKGDGIYVKLDSKEKRLPDPADNLLGGFMISEKHPRPTQ
ncbi:tumor necrosis factor ligand superfamily member 14-like [Xyrichtys novacula]|uniref:Tumor necrosis factor ligand superfamily member 14-like n=1 Tax=Xyrichtys novacula TaxID=13765 RepID=A0AAV1EWX4_XYRNO|nr:tumor necrosis factor ligand superfamily member 14-like [Xyrichtys novacula]